MTNPATVLQNNKTKTTKNTIKEDNHLKITTNCFNYSIVLYPNHPKTLIHHSHLNPTQINKYIQVQSYY